MSEGQEKTQPGPAQNDETLPATFQRIAHALEQIAVCQRAQAACAALAVQTSATEALHHEWSESTEERLRQIRRDAGEVLAELAAQLEDVAGRTGK